MKDTFSKNTTCISIDVEEWFQVENLRSAITVDQWDSYPSSVAANIDIILDILDRHMVKGTFFLLGWVAEHNPDLVRKIINNGHELASHGYGHQHSSNLHFTELKEDILKSKNILEDLTGKKLSGYRAPNFSINDDIIDIIKDLGFTYDSSYNPFQLHNRYGNFKKYRIQDKNIFDFGNGIFEIPIASIKFGNLHFPAGGGAYFRIFPYFIFQQLALFKGKRDHFYNFYLHPWEFEPDQPRVKGISLNHRLRHYTGLNKTADRLEKLIEAFKQKDFRFLTMKEYLKSMKSNEKIEISNQ